MQSWQLDHQVLQADDCDRSVSLRAALGYLYLLHHICFSLGVSWSTGQQLQPWFPVVGSSFASTALLHGGDTGTRGNSIEERRQENMRRKKKRKRKKDGSRRSENREGQGESKKEETENDEPEETWDRGRGA